MQAHQICAISVQPETHDEAQRLTTLLEHTQATWHIDGDGTYTIYPIQGMVFLQVLLTKIQAL
jgi:hypothetical protein